MILISHRGNLNGVDSERENSIEYISEALDSGFDVEVDVWNLAGRYLLGHDEPLHIVGKRFLQNDNLWCHAKNIQGLYSMMEDDIHCFWHQEDDVTLTSEGYLWTYPGKDLTKNSIAVLPDDKPDVEVAGVCSDYIKMYVDKL